MYEMWKAHKYYVENQDNNGVKSDSVSNFVRFVLHFLLYTNHRSILERTNKHSKTWWQRCNWATSNYNVLQTQIQTLCVWKLQYHRRYIFPRKISKPHSQEKYKGTHLKEKKPFGVLLSRLSRDS